MSAAPELIEQPIPPDREIRQAPLPKAHDPYQWSGWPLFELYGLVGDGRPTKGWTKKRT